MEIEIGGYCSLVEVKDDFDWVGYGEDGEN